MYDTSKSEDDVFHELTNQTNYPKMSATFDIQNLRLPGKLVIGFIDRTYINVFQVPINVILSHPADLLVTAPVKPRHSRPRVLKVYPRSLL